MASDTARLDTWLWAARFFKTRAQAAAAIDGGKVDVNGARAKRAKRVAPGDELRIRKSPFEYRVTVRGLAEQRGPPRLAAALYDEAPEGKRLRERLAEQLKLAPSLRYEGKGRPTKKDRREIEKLRRDPPPSPRGIAPPRTTTGRSGRSSRRTRAPAGAHGGTVPGRPGTRRLVSPSRAPSA